MFHPPTHVQPSRKAKRSAWQQRRTALGSEANIVLVGSGPTPPDKLFQTLWEQIDTFEKQFSRFEPESELSQLNRAAGKVFFASPALIDLLLVCRKMVEQTNGLFNPTILPVLVGAGYDRTFSEIQPSASGPQKRMATVPNFDLVEIDVPSRTVKLPAGCQLDFGGIGKGYLLDQLADSLEGLWPDFWISLGGDVVVCGVDQSGSAWQIEVADAHRTEENEAIVSPQRGSRLAVATSGTTKRRGVHHGRAWNHLIDPRTGHPTTAAHTTATVAGRRATVADVLAKCVVLAGGEIMTEEIKESYYLVSRQT